MILLGVEFPHGVKFTVIVVLWSTYVNKQPDEGVRELKARHQNINHIPDEIVYAMMPAMTVSVLITMRECP